MLKVGSAFIAGGIAACGAVTVTHPFETVKIRFASAMLVLLVNQLRSLDGQAATSGRNAVKETSSAVI